MPALTPEVVEQIRELRYMDGLPCHLVVASLGVCDLTVRKYAPGYPGKVSNVKVRALFEQSPLSEVEVARRMGWRKKSGPPRRVEAGDGVRVLRALGLYEDRSRGYRSFRSMIDAEVAGDLAEAMGYGRWEALPDDE